jgi:hypothetical protein
MLSSDRGFFYRSRSQFVDCKNSQEIDALLSSGWHRTIRQIQRLKIRYSTDQGANEEAHITTSLGETLFSTGQEIKLLLEPDGMHVGRALSAWDIVAGMGVAGLIGVLAAFLSKLDPKHISRHF